MKDRIDIKTFNFKNTIGFSKKQLQEHYSLYKGYVNKINEIWKTIDNISEFKNSNSTYSKLRCLKLGETYALDGVKLHELYFENLTGNNTKVYGNILKLLVDDFKSLSRWENYFKQTALSMRGWVVLSIDPIDNRLHLYGQDSHDSGVVLNSYPLLVLDVYEHAYMIDFGISREKYIEVFLKNIDWKVVNDRLETYMDFREL